MRCQRKNIYIWYVSYLCLLLILISMNTIIYIIIYLWFKFSLKKFINFWIKWDIKEKTYLSGMFHISLGLCLLSILISMNTITYIIIYLWFKFSPKKFINFQIKWDVKEKTYLSGMFHISLGLCLLSILISMNTIIYIIIYLWFKFSPKKFINFRIKWDVKEKKVFLTSSKNCFCHRVKLLIRGFLTFFVTSC